MDLEAGDHISLIKKDDLEEQLHHLVKRLEYELCRGPGEDEAIIPGEILVQTVTEPIIVDDDSETEKNVSAQIVTPDDYEIGEPSRIPPPPKPPKTDPVSIVSFNCSNISLFSLKFSVH